MTHKYQITVEAEAFYLAEQSSELNDRYAFAYRITLSNTGSEAAKLLSRHWLITDAAGKVQEVRGMGVVGENPHLAPGQSYTYTSGATLTTPYGSMKGSYQMLADDGTGFEADIPEFHLIAPRVLH